jgi:hypothetical protein
MSVSLIEAITQGGCYWKHEREDSPGHSIVLADGTPFKIALEGPQSHQFVSGFCRDGHYEIEDGTSAGIFQQRDSAVHFAIRFAEKVGGAGDGDSSLPGS